MLNSLSIKRFKSIREAQVDFGHVNLFIGGNGCGKSNILEAIGLLSCCFSRGIGNLDLFTKGIRLTPAEIMKSSFKSLDLPKTLELHGKFNDSVDYRTVLSSGSNSDSLSVFSESFKVKNRVYFGRSNAGITPKNIPKKGRIDKGRGMWDQIKTYIPVDDDIFDSFEEFAKFAIFSPQTDFLRGVRSQKGGSAPMGIHGEGITEALSSFMEKHTEFSLQGTEIGKACDKLMHDCVKLLWLPGWASQVRVVKPEDVITSNEMDKNSKEIIVFFDEFMHRRRNRLSVYDSSEGTLFLLFAALLLCHPDSPKIFAFDNIDSALNPKLTRALVEQAISVTKTATEQNLPVGARQIFMTSHNPSSLDAFNLFDDNQRVFVIKRQKNTGYTQIVRLKPAPGMGKEDWELAKGGRNLSQLWLDGEIDGACGEI